MNVTVSKKGRVIIPTALRQKYGIKPGMQLMVVDYGGVLALVPGLKNPVREDAGMLQGHDSLTALIVEDHRQDRERE